MMSTDTRGTITTAAEYLRDDDGGVLQFPGVADAGHDVADHDRGLALAFMREENAGDRRLRFSNRDLLWVYDGERGIWRRLSEGDLTAFNGRLYEFVRRHLGRDEMAKATSRYNSVRRMLFETLGEYHIQPDGFDGSPDLIAFRNGVYDVTNDRLMPHSPDHMLTVGRDYDHDPSATCPHFERFLDEVLVRHVDPADDTSSLVADLELRLLIEELLGYCLVAHCKAERWFLLYGEGRNGKSTLINVIRLVVGDHNVCDFDVRDIRNHQMTEGLVGKLVALQPEVEVGTTLPDAALKAVCSGEPQVVKVVFQKPFRFKPIATVIMATNNMPQTKDHSHGFRERMVVVPFLATLDNETADRELLDRFVPELAGIFNLAIEGYRRLRDNGWRFTEATAAREATIHYREDSDPILLWFNDALRASSVIVKVPTADLFDDYVAYCSRFRYQALNHNTFSKRLRKIVDGREGSPWEIKAADGTAFSMAFHRSAHSRAYTGTFTLATVTG